MSGLELVVVAAGLELLVERGLAPAAKKIGKLIMKMVGPGPRHPLSELFKSPAHPIFPVPFVDQAKNANTMRKNKKKGSKGAEVQYLREFLC